MARILVQTNDRRTVLDEADVRLADISDDDCAAALLDRLEGAIENAERAPGPSPPPERRRAIVPVSSYRDVCA
jgi:hypothetical protein